MRVFAILVPLLLMAIMAGCASSPELSLGYKYATLKLLENETVTADAVIERVDRVQNLMDTGTDLAFGHFVDRVKDAVGYSSLAPSDRLLIDALLGDAQLDLDVSHDSILSESHRLAINQRLQWIRDAAALASG